jgi:antitoxin component YwqK of YwqJK toxin-antitoxin module
MKISRQISLQPFLQCVVAVVFILGLASFKKTAAVRVNPRYADSLANSRKEREVLTSRQLFMIKVSPVKGKNAKKGLVDFKAELRDAFMVILYDKDTSRTELDWVMCPNGKCPIAATYKYGTPGYKQLDVWIANAKKSNVKSKKRKPRRHGAGG